MGRFELSGSGRAGEGLLLQASILYPHRHQPESAESIYEYVVAASEELRAVQEDAYLQYVGMLGRRSVSLRRKDRHPD